MKELQSIVNKHFDKLRHKKKYLAMVTALSMLVSFMVPLILTEPADSMTFKKVTLLANESSGKINVTDLSSNISGNSQNMIPNAAGADGNKVDNIVGNITYTPAQMDVLALLFGGTVNEYGRLIPQDIYKDCTSVEDALEVDKETYFLGFASDFCAFIEGDFTATDADAEGRVAVGGNLRFDWNDRKWNYQIGSGDYATMSPLDEIDGYTEYENIYGFASALVGGRMFRINTLSTGDDGNNADKTRHLKGKTAYYHPNEGLYKRFVVSSMDGFLHYDETNEVDIPYGDKCSHDYPSVDCTNCNHTHLGEINEKSQMYIYSGVKSLIQGTFDYVRTRSDALSHIQGIPGDSNVSNDAYTLVKETDLDENGNKLKGHYSQAADGTFYRDTENGTYVIDGSDINRNKVVFDATGKVPANAKTVYFTIDEWRDYRLIEFKGIPENAQIVINCTDPNPVYIGDDSEFRKLTDKTTNQDVKTLINGTPISINGHGKNNHEDSSRILYNFPNTNELHINGSFNGTVLCPNADAESNPKFCPGHLSGALIAKSFYGGLEFGYRPYRGSSDIFGMSSGYEVPVDKFITGSNKYLPGAMFDIVELVEDENHTFGENIVGLFESSGKTDFISLPSHIDYSGNTLYQYEKIEAKKSTKEETETGTAIDLVSPIEIKVNGTLYSELPADTAFDVGSTIKLTADQPIDISNNQLPDGVIRTSQQTTGTEFSFTITKPVTNNEFDIYYQIAGMNTQTRPNVKVKLNNVGFAISDKNITWGENITFTVTGAEEGVYEYKYYLSSDPNTPIFTTKELNYNYQFGIPTPGSCKIRLEAYYNGNKVWEKYSDDVTVNHNMELQLSSNEITVGESVTLSIKNIPGNWGVQYQANGTNQYIQTNGNQATFKPENTGSYTIKATFNNNNIQLEKTITVNGTNSGGSGNTGDNGNTGDSGNTTSKMSIVATPNPMYCGQTATLSVNDPPANAKEIKYYLKGLSSTSPLWELSEFSSASVQRINNNMAVQFNPGQSGSHTYIAKAFDSNGSYIEGSECELQITTNQTASATNLTLASARNISALADESDSEGNKIKVTSDKDGTYINEVKLKVSNKTDNFTLKASFYSGETLKSTKTYSAVEQINGSDCIVVKSDAADITKIEVEATTGFVRVDSYDVTKIVPCTEVTYTNPQVGNVNNEESYVIDLSNVPDDAKPIESFKIYFGADSGEFKLVLLDASGNEISYNYTASHDESFNGGKYEFNTNTVNYDNGASKNDIAKIKISSRNNSAFPVNYYTVTASKAADIEITPIEVKPIVEEHTYIIKEDTPPQGFLGTDKNYKVVISETLNIKDDVTDERYPTKVTASIKIYESKNGATFESTNDYTVSGKYTSILESEFTIENEYADTQNERTITYNNGGTTFKIVKNNDSEGEITSVQVKNGETYQDVVLDPTLGINKPQEFEHNGKRYYYNPSAMMIIPLPEDNLKYENTPGLLFEKVDDIGNDVTGVDIALKVKRDNGSYESVDSTIWTWDTKKNSKSIDVSALVTKYGGNAVYCFEETNEGDKYEKADNIYFKVIVTTGADGKSVYTVRYASSEADLADSEAESKPYKELDLVGERTITMIDNRVLGTQLKLQKIHKKEDGQIIELSGAKFELYADNGTTNGILLKENIVVDNAKGIEVDLTAGIQSNISNYIENGYLKPGNYFLYETTAPNGYKSGGKTYFTVDNDFNMRFVEKNEFNLVLERVQDGQSWPYILKDPNGAMMNIETPDTQNADKSVGIADVVEVKVEASAPFEQYWFTQAATTEGQVGTNNHNSTSCIVKYAQPVQFDKFKIYGNEGITFTITITKSDGTVLMHSPEIKSEPQEILQINNEINDGKIEIPVRKVWSGDDAFAAIRPEITVNLYHYIADSEISDRADLEQYAIEENKVGTVILGGNKWEHTFTGVTPSYEENGEIKQYFFFIKEETAVNGYSVNYSKDEFNTLIVTNTLEPISVVAEKNWSNPDNIEAKRPNSVTLKLQVQDGTQWIDVPNKTVVVNDANQWKGRIEGLLAGRNYRLTEDSVPGWSWTSCVLTVNATGNETLTITNTPVAGAKGSIQLDKTWDTDSTENLPDKVFFRLFRAKMHYPTQTAEEVQEDYARLLQYSLYFYDGLMCGDQVNETSAYSWRDDCHDDVKGTTEYDGITNGGFHDAGDHVMFGLPAGFSASTLGWSLYEFREQYDALNQTAHTKIITDHYADFFNKCIRTNPETGKVEILVQKGHGNTDHAYWGIPEGQTQDKFAKDSIEYWVSGTGADIASEYAAALALSYLNFYDTASEDEKPIYAGYLETAKRFYQYALDNPRCLNEDNINVDEINPGGYYISSDYKDDMAWAAAWLSIASTKANNSTDANEYKEDCQELLKNGMYDWMGYHWNSVKYGASLVNAAYLGGSWDTVAGFVNEQCKGSGYKNTNEWGCARYNTGYQTIGLIAAKHQENGKSVGIDVNTVKTWAKNQMNFILGDNKYDVCFVTGFAENSVKRPHFRAGSGQVFNMTKKDDTTVIDSYDDKNILLGGLVGGPNGENAAYADVRSDYKLNEIASDYNANLVGAAAGLYYFFKTGKTYDIPGLRDGKLYTAPKDANADPANLFSMVSVSLGEGIDALASERAHTIVDAAITFSETNNSQKDYNINLENVSKIEVEYSFDGANGGAGFNFAINYWSAKLQPGQGNGVLNSETQRYTFTHSYATPINIQNVTIQKPWNASSVTVYKVVIYTQVAGLSINGATIVVGDTVVLETSGKANGSTVTWTLPGGGSHTGDSYTFNASSYKAGDTVTFTVNDGTNEDTKTFTIQSLTISGETSMNVGDTQQLDINSNKDESEFNWTIPAEQQKFATVDGNGKVTALSAGNVTVTAEHGGYTATFNITVSTGPTTYTVTDVGTIKYNGSDSEKKVELPLTLLPKGAVLKKVYVTVSSQNTIGEMTYAVGAGGSGTLWHQDPDTKITMANGGVVSYDATRYNDIDRDTGKFMFGVWWANSDDISVDKIVFEYEVQRSVTGPIEMMVGTPGTFTATGFGDDTLWSYTKVGSAPVSIDGASGTTCQFTPSEAGKYKVIATDTNGSVESAEINVSAFALRFDSADGFKLRNGKPLTPVFNTNAVDKIKITETGGTSYLDVKGTTITLKDNVPVGTQITFTAVYGNNESSVTGTITVADDLVIEGDKETVTNDTLQFSTKNHIGNVTWSVANKDSSITTPLATIDESGKLTAGSKSGKVTVRATDSDGTTKTVDVTIKPKCVDVDVAGLGLTDITVEKTGNTLITLTPNSQGEWKKLIDNLELCDSEGNYYCYYIVECDENGNLIESDDHIMGKNGAMFVPTAYENNGTILNTNGPINITVNNAQSGEVQGQMPSTGGDGTTTYYSFGAIIMLLSAAGFIGLKRRQRSQRSE